MMVTFPCYGGCEYGSLNEAVSYVRKMPGGLSVYIADIVLYNIRLRDCLRAKGIGGVIEMLTHEAPSIAHETEAIDNLKWKWTDRMKEHIADYDIQCLPKDGLILIEDYLFNGLNEIFDQVEMAGSPRYSFDRWYATKDPTLNAAGLHIGRLVEDYPRFDSSDYADGRCYNNFVFSRQPLTEAMMEQYSKQIPAPFDFCMVHEHIPEALLPILYYNGDSDNVLLATAK